MKLFEQNMLTELESSIVTLLFASIFLEHIWNLFPLDLCSAVDFVQITFLKE